MRLSPSLFFTFLLFSALGFASGTMRAQCTNVNLLSQFSVDHFKSSYGCTKITGTLFINGSDITNLDSLHLVTEVGSLVINSTNITSMRGLNALQKVAGGVSISFCPNLTEMFGLEALQSTGDIYLAVNAKLATLQGMNGLKYVKGAFQISDNDVLLSLQGLEGLDSVAGQLKVEGNAFLQTLEGLGNLRSAGDIRIQNNSSLYSLTDFNNLSKVPGGIVIYINAALTSLGDFPKLKEVGTRFYISVNPALQSLQGLHLESLTADSVDFGFGLYITDTQAKDLHGLESLTSIQGRLYIGYNPQLKSFDGLQNLQTLEGHLGIEDNTVLTSIEAIKDLNFYGGEIELTDNDSLSACAIESVCHYLDSPDGLVLVWGNGPGCTSADEIRSNCSPVEAFNLIDANLYADDDDMTSGDIRNLHPQEIADLTTERAAVATDGVSTVLLRIAMGPTGYLELDDPDEDRFEFPWGDSTYFLNGNNYLFMLYTPKDTFDESANLFSYGDNVDAYNLSFPFRFYTATDVRENHFSITHVRPPVVLMHGTYSDPAQAWRTAATGGVSMYDRLTSDGFKVFTVNYKETNGTTGFAVDNTGFTDNAKVLWGDVYPENTGGIKDALTYYRHTLGIAVTQADVVGHSLGGILPRVYASAHYNPNYKREDNFMKGDINRLITLGSTHFGSHLGELQIFLDGITPFDIGALDWLALQGVNLVTNWVGGASPSKAVMDQIPPPVGTALPLIGRTEIPSHALTFSVPKGALKDSIYDPDESYYDLYWFITTLMYQLHDVQKTYLDYKLQQAEGNMLVDSTIHGGKPADLYPLYTKAMLFKNMIEDAIQKAGIVTSVLDGTFELPSDKQIFKYALSETSMSDYADPLYDLFIAGADPVGVAADYFFNVSLPSPQSILKDQLKVREETIEGLRSLIFNNDENDGVVRVQSQSGELEKECGACVDRFENVLHGFAPRYPAVQERVEALLKGNMAGFAKDGFPPMDHAQHIYYPPESLDLFKVAKNGGEAICQSGIVPSHARAFAHIADEKNVILIMRPVNPDGTDLIANGAATKGMDIKPKSSNWGPQKGFLPVKQRYSKIWKVYEDPKRQEVIHKYDSLAQKNISDGIAVPRQLIAQACNGPFVVYIDQAKISGPEDARAEDEVVLIPVADPTKVCYWGEDFSSDEIISDCEDIGPQHLLIPFQVMASPEVFEEDGVTPRFLTADYDMLMIGFYEGPDQGPPMPPTVPFKPKVGQITAEQEALVAQLNQAVAETGYHGGQVVHHGPENQFNNSPYIDYPLTVFAPDNIPNGLFNTSTDGLILSIDMGPAGFRDLNLKQFVNRMRQAGYDLYQNIPAPGWKWTWDEDAEGFELEDHMDLADYVEQLPKNDCSKFGGKLDKPCPAFTPTDDSNNDHPNTISKEGRSTRDALTWHIYPSLFHNQPVLVSYDGSIKNPFTWTLVDAYGNILAPVQHAETGSHNFLVETGELAPGLYSILTDSFGEIGRFIKVSSQ